jgi:hypothetical protein
MKYLSLFFLLLIFTHNASQCTEKTTIHELSIPGIHTKIILSKHAFYNDQLVLECLDQGSEKQLKKNDEIKILETLGQILAHATFERLQFSLIANHIICKISSKEHSAKPFCAMPHTLSDCSIQCASNSSRTSKNLSLLAIKPTKENSDSHAHALTLNGKNYSTSVTIYLQEDPLQKTKLRENLLLIAKFHPFHTHYLDKLQKIE